MIKKLLLVITFLLPISIISFVVKYKTIFLNEEEISDEKLQIMINLTDLNITIDLNEYIIGVVAGEMPALFEKEALKAQAVAARSYALSAAKNDLIKITSGINDQVYLTQEQMQTKWGVDYDEYYAKIAECVLATKNIVIKRDNKILRAYYFSMSNGYTEDSQSVFGENKFVSVESKWDNENINNFVATRTFTEKELLNLLKLSEANLIIGNIQKSHTNHVENIEVNNIIFTGIEFRKLLSLRSTDFKIDRNDSNYIITTKGYGHGVGMSQYGANGMAKEGYNYQEILEYYYNNIKIENI